MENKQYLFPKQLFAITMTAIDLAVGKSIAADRSRSSTLGGDRETRQSEQALYGTWRERSVNDIHTRRREVKPRTPR